MAPDHYFRTGGWSCTFPDGPCRRGVRLSGWHVLLPSPKDGAQGEGGVPTSLMRRIYVSLPANPWLARTQNARTWAIVHKIEGLDRS
jgi:hypothetical protein